MAENKKRTPKKKVYICVALKNQKAHLCGEDFEFKEGEQYKLSNKEVVEKLTNPLNGTLKILKE